MTREDRILAQLNELAEESPSTHAMHRAYPGLEREIAEILPIHMRLKQLPRDVVPSATGKARLRAQVMSAAREEMAARSVRPGWYRVWESLAGALTPSSMAYALARPAAAILAVVMTFTAAGANTVWASMDTIPGELLYPVKTAVEQSRLALAFTDEAKTQVHIWVGAHRVGELDKMVQSGRTESFKQVLREYKDNVTEAQKLAASTAGLHERTMVEKSRQEKRLEKVSQRAPEQMQNAIALVLSVNGNQPAPAAPQGTQPQAAPQPAAPEALVDMPAPAAAPAVPVSAAIAPATSLPQKGGAVTDEPLQKGAPVAQAPTQPPDDQQLPAKTGDTGPASGPVASKDTTTTPVVEPSKTDPAATTPLAPSTGGVSIIPDKSEPTSVPPAAGVGAPKGQGSDPVQSPIGGGLGPKR